MRNKQSYYQKAVLSIVVGICLFMPAACTNGMFRQNDLAAIELESAPDSSQTPTVCLENPDAECPPQEVAGLQLSGQVKGEEATSLIKTILGPGYNIVDTQIITYRGSASGSPDELVFWTAEFHDAEEAAAVINEMKQYLESSLYFCDHGCWSNEEREIYYARFTGKDIPLEHSYYYRDGNKVYCVTIASEKPLELLIAFLGKI